MQANRHLLLSLLIVGWFAFDPAPGLAQQPPSARTDYLGDPLPEGAVFRLGTSRLLHPGPVGAVLFTDDGNP